MTTKKNATTNDTTPQLPPTTFAALPPGARFTKPGQSTVYYKDGTMARASGRTPFVMPGATKVVELPSDECPQCSRIGRGPLCKAHAEAVTFDPKSTSERIARAAWNGATQPADRDEPVYTSDRLEAMRINAVPLSLDEKLQIERARRERPRAAWQLLPKVECACGQTFYQEHAAQLQCRDCMRDDDDAGFTFYAVGVAERAAWRAANDAIPVETAFADLMPTRTGPVDVSAYAPAAYGSRGDAPSTRYIVRCRVSGGVTGTRESVLKSDGAVRYFPTREAAQAEADRLLRQVSGGVARFQYWPEEAGDAGSDGGAL